jgi:predicted nucleic acid-binding protein
MSAEPNTGFFIDTNILVYAFDHSAGRKHQIASQLVRECWENESGCLSIQVLQEFYVTLTRKISKPIEPLLARQVISDLAEWRMRSPDVSDVLQAIDYQQAYRLSFWDAMILQSAVRLGCTQILTEDMNHGQVFGPVRVVNPFIEGRE